MVTKKHIGLFIVGAIFAIIGIACHGLILNMFIDYMMKADPGVEIIAIVLVAVVYGIIGIAGTIISTPFLVIVSKKVRGGLKVASIIVLLLGWILFIANAVIVVIN